MEFAKTKCTAPWVLTDYVYPEQRKKHLPLFVSFPILVSRTNEQFLATKEGSCVIDKTF